MQRKTIKIPAGCIVTNPNFSDRTRVWKATKSGNKSRTGAGWDILSELSKENGMSPDAFCREYEPGVFRDHVELDLLGTEKKDESGSRA